MTAIERQKVFLRVETFLRRWQSADNRMWRWQGGTNT